MLKVIQNLKKNNKISENHDKSKKKKYLNDESDEESFEIIQKGNKRKKLKKRIIEVNELDEYEIKEIFSNNNVNRISIIKYIKSLKIKTRFLFTAESKNYIYYSCYKKIKKCKGTAKINKNSKKFWIQINVMSI